MASNGSVKETTSPHPSNSPVNFFRIDVLLRLLLFSTSVAALVVAVTSKETAMIPAVHPVTHQIILLPRSAMFQHSPALIYLISSLAAACLYGLITIAISASSFSKPSSTSTKIIFHFIVFDLVMLAVMASATGTGGAVAYIGLKGDEHVNWRKICDFYGKFCRHIGTSILLSLFASVTLITLVVLSSYSLYRRSR